jgi:alkylhydroperoxidase family enzyme
MAVVNPVPKDKASGDVKPIYEDLTKRFGRVPNIFGVMAQRPDVLKNFLPFYGAVVTQGTVEPKLKEFAYLKVSMVNGCEY